MRSLSDDIILNKKHKRKEILKIRDEISKNKRDKFDIIIFEKLKALEEFKESNNIFIYIGFGSEIDTKVLILDMIKEGKRVYVPKILGKNMILIEITSLDNLIQNKFKILEPIGDKNEIDVDNLDLVIMPGIVFDRKGNRIGYGGGFYDRYLENSKSTLKKIALAYSIQLLENIDVENHDLKVDLIITEKEIIKL